MFSSSLVVVGGVVLSVVLYMKFDHDFHVSAQCYVFSMSGKSISYSIGLSGLKALCLHGQQKLLFTTKLKWAFIIHCYLAVKYLEANLRFFITEEQKVVGATEGFINIIYFTKTEMYYKQFIVLMWLFVLGRYWDLGLQLTFLVIAFIIFSRFFSSSDSVRMIDI